MNQRGDKNRQSDISGHQVFYHPKVVKYDIPRLIKTERNRVKIAVENKIVIDPVLYGTPLRGVYKQYWKLRVGNWRIVYTLRRKAVYILIIAHRKDVYQIGERRL
ncbi:MAG: type II toxin-antitoxin system RelE/ParE family toxin [Candidatus Pacebacteria bacterium]|nr:type II toxin-antitoxin system RelE/ParE family toxin [Candidatus Paceibacterota bacterium]